MLRPFVRFSSVFCAAAALTLALSAQPASKPASLVGSTRDQVIAKLGEPKSNLKAGAREVLFFPRMKLTLRNGVVIDLEELADSMPAPAVPPSAPVAPPAPTAQQLASAAALASNAEVANPQPAHPVAPEPSAAAPKPPPETPLEIKSIRSTSAGTKAVARPPTSTGTPAATAVSPTPAAPKSGAIAAAELNPDAANALRMTTRPAVMPDARHPVVVEEMSITGPAPEKPPVDPKKKASLRQRWRMRRDAETEDDAVQIFSVQSYVIAAVLMCGGAAFLWWQWTQRKLALAATAVSQTPFEPSAPVDTTAQFTAELVGRLSAKKFERLVAAYYAKTGVVAERTNAAPGSPVHIKIFWKGETKPFAGVQCHSNPPILIGPKPLQELFEALTAADIRRGYVVTNGKFNVEARDYAEERHFTLLSGDIFVEKLNALPPMARADLLKETAAPEENSAPVVA
jgi:hypothetical protein